MRTDASLASSASASAIAFGDVVAFLVESEGYLAVPSQTREPLPECEDPTTHLRGISTYAFENAPFPSDFSVRCYFRILGSEGQMKSEKLKYGSIVRLVHEPSGLHLVAGRSSQPLAPSPGAFDDTPSPVLVAKSNSQAKYSDNVPVLLQKSPSADDLAAAQWIVTSRYRLRTEGDFVQSNDYIVLRNAHYKAKQLTTIRAGSLSFDALIALGSDAFTKKGWQVLRMSTPSSGHESTGSTGNVVDSNDSEDIAEESSVFGGDFVKFLHQELRGHLICRQDDEKHLKTGINPLGLIVSEMLIDQDRSHGLFVRSGSELTDSTNCKSIWQIIPKEGPLLGRLKSGQSVRLRHLLTGLYLCIRDVSEEDCEVIRLDSVIRQKRRGVVLQDGDRATGARSVAIATTSLPSSSTVFNVHTGADISTKGLNIELSKGQSFLSYGDSIFFVHSQTSFVVVTGDSSAPEPRWIDYAKDYPLKPVEIGSDVAILSQAFRLERVDKCLVEDIMFASHFLPLAKAAISYLQITPRADQLYAPLFRHFGAALRTLVRWVLDRSLSDGSLLPHPRTSLMSRESFRQPVDNNDDPDLLDETRDKDVIILKSQESVDANATSMTAGTQDSASRREAHAWHSALAPWVGLGTPLYSKTVDAATILSERDPNVKAKLEVNVQRQNILLDSGLLFMLFHYTNLVFRMVKTEAREVGDFGVIDRGSEQFKEKQAIYSIPPVVIGCCVLCYDVINIAVVENSRNAIKVLMLRGSLMAMLSHEFLGWKPPVEQILIAEQSTLEQHKGHGSANLFELSKVISPDDIRNLVRQMYDQNRSKNPAAMNLLHLLTILCSPGRKPNKFVQNAIIQELFVSAKTSVSSKAFDDERALINKGGEVVHSPLFSTRRRGLTDAWEVSFQTKFKFEKNVKLDSTAKQEIISEYSFLWQLFDSSRLDDYEVLGIVGSENFAEKLGLIGADLYWHAKTIELSDFKGIINWWWSYRSFYFPSVSSSLNEMTAADAERMIKESDLPSYLASALFPHDESVASKASKTISGINSLFGQSNVPESNLIDAKGSKNPPKRGIFGGSFPWSAKADLKDAAKGTSTAAPTKVPFSLNPAPSLASSKKLPIQEPAKSQKITIEILREKLLRRIPGFDIFDISGDNSKANYFNILTLPQRETIKKMRKGELPDDDDDKSSGYQKYSGLFVNLTKPFEGAKQNLMKLNENRDEWRTIASVLADDSIERSWFRNCCLFIAELCRDNNSLGQDFASELLPPDLILHDLLAVGGIGKIPDKIIGCALLSSLYVLHDFVFPSSTMTTDLSAYSVVHYNRISKDSYSAAGKLFNQPNRRKLHSALNNNISVELRRKLWGFLSRELKTMKIAYVAKDELEYQVELLRVIGALFRLGFFEEAEDFWLRSVAAMQQVAPERKKNLSFSFMNSSSNLSDLGEKFDVDALEFELLSKLKGASDSLRKDFSSLKNSLMSHLQATKSQGVISEDEAERVVQKLNRSPGPSFGVEHSKYTGIYFHDHFSDANRIAVVHETLTILSKIFEFRQIGRISTISSCLQNPADIFPQKFASDERGEQDFDFERFNLYPATVRLIQREFKEDSKASAMYFDALLYSTLYDDDSLRITAYSLMKRAISMQIDASSLLTKISLVPNENEVAASNFLKAFYHIINKVFSEMLLVPDAQSKYDVDTIRFCFDAILAICFRTAKTIGTNSKVPSVQFEPHSESDSIERGISMVSIQGAASNNDVLDKLIDGTVRASHSIPNPSIPGVYFISKETLVKLFEIFQTCTKLTKDQFRNGMYLKSTNQFSWVDMSLCERFYVNRFFSFIAKLSYGSAAIVYEFLNDYSSVVKSLWWVKQCVGAAEVMESLCLITNINDLLEPRDIDDVFAAALNTTGFEQRLRLIALRTIYAILTNSHSGSIQSLCVDKVRSELLENSAIFPDVKVSLKDSTDYERSILIAMLRIFCATLRLKATEATKNSMRELLNVPYCVELLTDSSALQIKSCIIEIAGHLHKYGELPVEQYVLTDIRMFCQSVPASSLPTKFAQVEAQMINYSFHSAISLLFRRALTLNRPDYRASVDQLISRTKSYLNENKSKIKGDMIFEIARANNFGFDEATLFSGEPIDPRTFSLGPVPHGFFFEVVFAVFDLLDRFSTTLLFTFCTDSAFQPTFMRFLASLQYIYRLLHPSDKFLDPDAAAAWKRVFGMLPRCMLIYLEFISSKSTADFLRSDGCDAFLTAATRIMKPPLNPSEIKASLSKKRDFYVKNDLNPDIPYEILRNSSFFQRLQTHLKSSVEFERFGGLALDYFTANSGSELTNMRDFDIWLRGGGKYFASMSRFVRKNAQQSEVSFILLHIFIMLLANQIDEIRSSNISVKKMIEKVDVETSRLRDVQNSLSSCGVVDMIATVLRASYGSKLNTTLIAELIPLALKTGSALMAAGNTHVQNQFILSQRRVNYLASFRYILRKCSSKIIQQLKTNSKGDYPMHLFKLITEIYSFSGNLCSGHNRKGRDFFRLQTGVDVSVNVVIDLASSLNAVLSTLIDRMKYIEYDAFYEHLGTYVWRTMSDAKRRMVAWHLADNSDFYFMSQLTLTVVAGFDALTQICQDQCIPNQELATSVLAYCPQLLEYTGALQLRVDSSPDGRSSKVLHWNCTDPYAFYRTYKHEAKICGIFGEDPENERIRTCIDKWAKVSGFRRFYSDKTSIDILGIDLGLFQELFGNVEESCLRFICTLLDGGSETVVDNLLDKLDESILLQNMDNMFKASFNITGSAQERMKANLVQYLTLLTTLASYVNKSSAHLDKYIDEWQADCEKQGKSISDYFASVEVSSPNGSLQRIFFPVPEYVLTYWGYPRVQQAKETALWTVSRESPEDKLASFYTKIVGINRVMRRQQLLASLFPFLAWMRKLLLSNSVLSNLPLVGFREAILYLTLFLNVYYAYINYRDTYTWIIPSEQSWFREFMDWEDRKFALFIVGCVHVGLCGILALTSVVNSTVTDELEPIQLPGRESSKIIYVIAKILEYSRDVVFMSLSAWWPFLITLFSFLGLFKSPFWYALVLLDVIPQINLMIFLVEAITRNTKKIFYTLLLAAIFLYLFAVAAVVFIPNQYGFDGRYTCTDLISCFKLHLDFGLTNPPEWIGSDNISPSIEAFTGESTYGYVISLISGSIYNAVFVILINLVLQAIISGLIIDTFGEMRAENEAIENDIESMCFICSIDRDEFEQAGVSFEQHIKNEHNMWKYLWFQIYLDLKDPLSYTAPENYAHQLFGDKQSFVKLGPVKKSLSIQRRAGAVREEFTPKNIYEAIQKVQGYDVDILESLQQMLRAAGETSKTLTTQAAVVNKILASVETSDSREGEFAEILNRMHEFITDSSSSLRKSMEQKLASVNATVSELATKIDDVNDRLGK